MNVPTEFDDSVMWAAWLYYVDQLTQSEIAKKLAVSRATIVNWLQEARERGLASVTISPAIGGRTRVARALMQRFRLDGAFVIPPGEPRQLYHRLGEAGARVLAAQVVAGDVIGVAWGRTVLAVADCISLPRPVPDLTVVQVTGSSIGAADFSPELCTSLLSSRIGARCVNLLAPAVLSTRALRTALLAEPVLQKQMQLVHSANRVLFGVGDIGPGSTVEASGIVTAEELADYAARGAVSVLLGRFIDRAGRPISSDHDARMVGISLDDLKRVPYRLCVAGGPGRLAALQAALAAGYASHFVTDLATAEALLAG